MSLSEKAKTGREICDSIMEFYKGLGMARLEGKWYISFEEFKRRELEEWVRLEDHQQAIDKYKTYRDNAYKKWCKSQVEVERLERERGEQKQKIEHLWETLPLEYDVEIDEVTELGSKMQWREWLKKLKELLK